MSFAREHAQWLSLLEVSGPFLTMPVLLHVFPQGLDAHDPVHFRRLKLGYEEWESEQGGASRPAKAIGPDGADGLAGPDGRIHHAWIDFVLGETLEMASDDIARGQDIPQSLRVEIPEHGEVLRPDLVLRNPAGRPDAGQVRLLVCIYPSHQDLDRPVEGHRWKASTATRMMELLHGTGIRLGMVTNGRSWMLVDAPGRDTTGFATWDALHWTDEPLTLRAFRSLLGARRLFGAPDRTLEAMLAQSAAQQQEVTDQLGLQVRRAVEVLVHALDKADRDRGRTLLTNVEPASIYEAALAVMMRLVFLFSAEERGLLRLGERLYDENYAVSTLRSALRETADQHGEEVLERDQDAWARILATFRAVHGGIAHEALRLPAYGGHLFDPDRYPFLEGRAPGTSWKATPARPLPINNRTVLHLLEALQLLQMKVGGTGVTEARRLSFKSLDIEQIGHVYEGLLDHTAVRATAPVLGLKGTKDREPEVPLDRLASLRQKGTADLVAFLRDATGKSVQSLKKNLAYPEGSEDASHALVSDALMVVCEGSAPLYEAVKSYAGLVRDDDLGYPVVIDQGGIYVTQASERRTTGTHYTPRGLTEPIVTHTLDPLVYEGPADGRPRSDWKLRPARRLLALRVCDMAMGSGAFLVQTCRYLSERLVESWEEAAALHPGACGITPDGSPSEGRPGEQIIPAGTEERLALARRLVAERCLYGVDKNPLAAEMAKLSLWLVTLDRNRPFTFVDHALRAGDSLLGVTHVEQVASFHLDAVRGARIHEGLLDIRPLCRDAVERASALRRKIESFTVKDVKDAQEKERLLGEADAALGEVRVMADLLVGAALACAGKGNDALDAALRLRARDLRAALEHAAGTPARREAMEALRDVAQDLLDTGLPAGQSHRRPFHWALEFPEVFGKGDWAKVVLDAKAVTGGIGAISDTGGSSSGAIGPISGTGGSSSGAIGPISGTGGSGSGDIAPISGTGGSTRGAVDPIAGAGDRGRGGFDAIVGNPPFSGGQKITGTLGDGYREHLVERVAGGCRGSADLCAYFFLRVADVLVADGTFGLLATNTIAQGDTREVGLDQLLAGGLELHRATPSMKWPGDANLEVAQVWGRKGAWRGERSIDGHVVSAITSLLAPPGRATGKPHRLAANAAKSFQGSIVLGLGFVLEPEDAEVLIRKDSRNRDVLFPYLNGEDLNSRPDQSPSRWVINFHDWPLERAETYPDCMKIVREKVKPERDRLKDNPDGRRRKRNWWLYGRDARGLYATIAGMKRVMVRARIANLHSIAWVPAGWVYNEKTVLFVGWPLAAMQSAIHEAWAREFSSTLRADMQYTPSDCFETFPFPDLSPASPQSAALDRIGEAYHEHRRQFMLSTQLGLTKTYNRFHDRTCDDAAIARLRKLHVEMDRVVAAAYGWTDLDLGHGFHSTKQGLRFTVSEPARREILDRLLELNHQRHAAEVAQGLHQPRKAPGRRKTAKVREPAQESTLPFTKEVDDNAK